MRKPVIGVMGGASVEQEVFDIARELGALIARRGWVLLNGGRDCGVSPSPSCRWNTISTWYLSKTGIQCCWRSVAFEWAPEEYTLR